MIRMFEKGYILFGVAVGKVHAINAMDQAKTAIPTSAAFHQVKPSIARVAIVTFTATRPYKMVYSRGVK